MIIEKLGDKGDLSYVRNLMLNKLAGDLFPPQRRILITVKKTDLISKAFKTLIDNHLLSAPVYDVKGHAYVGFIDMLDMVAHVLAALTEEEITGEPNMAELLESKRLCFANDTCGTITDLSKRNPYYPVEVSTTVLTVVNLVSRVKVHRIPVITKENELSTVITQSHIIHLIASHLSHFGAIISMTVGDLRLGYTNVITINETERAIEAFKKMYEHGVSAIGVVDDSGKLVGNVSNSDLKVIGYDAALLSHLFIPITEFMAKLPKNEIITGPIAVTPESTFEEAVTKLHITRVHRVYVVQDHKPVGIITGLEIIRAINALLHS